MAPVLAIAGMKHLASFANIIPPQPAEEEPERKKTKPAKNAQRFELRSELHRITGVDLTRIDHRRDGIPDFDQ
jgi:hypothetical protein